MKSVLLSLWLLALAFALSVAPRAFAQNQPPTATEGTAPASVAPSSAGVAPGHSTHSVTMTFDYDFTLTPACTRKIRERCIERFVAYDISAGLAHRARLFTIPVPDGAKGKMQGITATGPKMDFESGKHLLAVTAQEPSGMESKHFAATVWVVIP